LNGNCLSRNFAAAAVGVGCNKGIVNRTEPQLCSQKFGEIAAIPLPEGNEEIFVVNKALTQASQAFACQKEQVSE
jgi:hypothetical protein